MTMGSPASDDVAALRLNAEDQIPARSWCSLPAFRWSKQLSLARPCMLHGEVQQGTQGALTCSVGSTSTTAAALAAQDQREKPAAKLPLPGRQFPRARLCLHRQAQWLCCPDSCSSCASASTGGLTGSQGKGKEQGPGAAQEQRPAERGRRRGAKGWHDTRHALVKQHYISPPQPAPYLQQHRPSQALRALAGVHAERHAAVAWDAGGPCSRGVCYLQSSASLALNSAEGRTWSCKAPPAGTLDSTRPVMCGRPIVSSRSSSMPILRSSTCTEEMVMPACHSDAASQPLC